MGTIKDPIKIKLSPDLYVHLLSICEEPTADVPISVREVINECNKIDCCLTFNDFKWFCSKLPANEQHNIYKYIDGSRIILPKPEELPRNPELQARIERLKLEVAEKEYESMTRNVNTTRSKHPEDSVASQMKEMNRQMIAAFQVVLSSSAGFAFGFSGVEYITGNLDMNARILLGLFFAGLIFVAELYFLIKKLEDSELSAALAQQQPRSDSNSEINDHTHRE